ncbi:helix-turn-helix transcriptional regulator [Microbacterium sp. USTB-Y]|uniref:helix-turn-helix domain-containing protein n=1 Tax=Microbacterium sp. USTB-Y TaxID=2823692 RepID=UPI00203E7E3C|nr:helix-turn-helix transcriptional regulator [Microbacterium sp. USTB-Y]
MSERANIRKNLGLTQSEAAARAKVSLATWRRWEADHTAVAAETSQACERVLDVRPLRVAGDDELFERQWANATEITPRQAFALAVVLDLWADELREWIASPEEPLHQVGPFAAFDGRVMFYIGDNRAYAEEARERCAAVAGEIGDGVLPVMRPGRFIDEVLIGAALPRAQDLLADMPEMFEGITARPGNGDDGIGDEDWDVLSDWLDDEAHSADWEVPLGLPSLPLLLEDRHPFTWFDAHRTPPSHSLHVPMQDRLPDPDTI